MRGKALVGKQPRWRYRVGDYRIVCEIRENELLITVIAIDHRKDVYR
jgi:mRNA interferase RelE/StbE